MATWFCKFNQNDPKVNLISKSLHASIKPHKKEDTNMGSTFTLKAKTSLRTSFLTLWKSAELLSSARSLCIRDTKSILNGKQTDKRESRNTDGQTATKNSRQGRADLCNDDVDKNGTRSTLWQRSHLPKSVFAAGTAKRMAGLLKKKASPDYNEKEPQDMKGKGTKQSFSVYSLYHH